MSWQTVLEERLMCELPGGGALTEAAIMDLADGSVVAASYSFPVPCATPDGDEFAGLVAGFDDTADLKANGFHLANTKFFLTACEPGKVIRATPGLDGGVVIRKTPRMLVFGMYESDVQPAECDAVVAEVADVLIDAGN